MIATLRAALLLAASAMLCPGRILAQTQPAQPTTPAAVLPSTPAPAPALADDLYRLGRIYRIETLTGSTFTGTLISLSLSDLELETKDLGRITVPRSNIRRSYDETLASGITTAPASYYDIGNGNRLFFAPTGRGLRRGEGDLHDVDLFLVGVNYGITDNFSLGGYVSLVPFVPLSEQLLILTPKFSAAVAPKLNLGVGALYINVPFTGSSSGGAGILYGALTYGSAASNLTLGLGYGFFQGKIGSTPVLQIGGQTRVSRRISLVSENYIIADKQAGMGGLYGIKINWRRVSLGIGAAYVYIFPYTETITYTSYTYNPNTGQNVPVTNSYPSSRSGQFISGYILPSYIDFNFRFGKGTK